MRPTQAALHHVRLYGLTTAPVAARALHLTTPAAHALLDGLARTGGLFQHRHHGALYFTPSQEPLEADRLRTAFGVLWFSCMSHPAHPLLPPPVLEERLRRAALETTSPFPTRAHCYERSDGSLALIRVAHPAPPDVPVDPQRILGGLQRFVESRRFRLWREYACKHPFSVTCLVDEASSAEELSAWLAAHPLVACERERRGEEGVGEAEPLAPVVPVDVVPLKEIRRRAVCAP